MGRDDGEVRLPYDITMYCLAAFATVILGFLCVPTIKYFIRQHMSQVKSHNSVQTTTANVAGRVSQSRSLDPQMPNEQRTRFDVVKCILWPSVPEDRDMRIRVHRLLFGCFSYGITVFLGAMDVDFSCMLSPFVAHKDGKQLPDPHAGLYNDMVSYSATLYEHPICQAVNVTWLAFILHWCSESLDTTTVGPYYKGFVLGPLLMWTVVFDTGTQPDHGAWVSVMAAALIIGILVQGCRNLVSSSCKYSNSDKAWQVLAAVTAIGIFGLFMTSIAAPFIRNWPPLTMALIEVTGINCVVGAFYLVFHETGADRQNAVDASAKNFYLRDKVLLVLKGSLVFFVGISFFNLAGLFSGFTNLYQFYNFPHMGGGDPNWVAGAQYELSRSMLKNGSSINEICAAYNSPNSVFPPRLGGFNPSAREGKDFQFVRNDAKHPEQAGNAIVLISLLSLIFASHWFD